MEADNTRQIEAETRKKYEGGTYKPECICAVPQKEPRTYADILLGVKFSLLKNYLNEGYVLDLCCASGLHLVSISDSINIGFGLDFSHSFIEEARKTKVKKNAGNVVFVGGNARACPFRDNSFDCVYSFSSLYTIPNVDEVIHEISRILKIGGKCVIEMGNIYSLNTIVCKAHPELAAPCFIPVKMMRAILRKAELRIVEHRAFQLLPLWGDRPRWLYPILAPFWNRLMKKRIGGKMIDEHISNISLFKLLAFRHIFVCEK